MAKYQLLLPKMGESVAEATIIKWNKNPGDNIEADEAVMEIATDKVDSEVPSPVSGKLVEQLCKPCIRKRLGRNQHLASLHMLNPDRILPALASLRYGARAPPFFPARFRAPEFRAARRCS